tara:strand:- start:380 stop:583 length:204 start_codon:yes stop_codon:yes gene_type:complete
VAALTIEGGMRVTPADAAQIAYRVEQMENYVGRLERKVDRLVWALVSLSLTIAASAIVFALTVTSVR